MSADPAVAGGGAGRHPGHPSLRFKKLAGHEQVWSVRVSRDFRAVGERHGDTIEWAWIGSHQEFDRLFGA